MRISALLIGLFLVSPQLLQASGWDCFGGNYRAKVRNSNYAPRTPAVFVVSHRKQGTLIKSYNEDIAKEMLSRSTRYSAFGPGEQLFASLTVSYREGVSAPVDKGYEVEGKLRLEEREERSLLVNMVCRRYLKND